MRLYSLPLATSLLLIPTCLAGAAEVQQLFHYQSSITSDPQGPLDLRAELNFDDSRSHAPIAVVMHGYSPASGNFGNVRANAQRLRDAGFFVVSVAMRGRDGSDGVRDSGGLEIYDIYDAVEGVKATFPQLVDPSNVHITGYSGGGGNAMSALTKFPDYFRAGSSYFGISDYGYVDGVGWYTNGAGSGHRSQLRTDIGDPTQEDPDVVDRYHARASSLAARNNPYSEIHLFVNDDEPTCPPINVTSYRDNAVAAASEEGEFDNIHVHIAPSHRPLYHDFNENGVNEANERQWWPHGFPSADEQHAAESWYLSRLLDGSLPEPVLNSSDELFVAGFVKTKKFEFWIGDGQNGAGVLDYSLAEQAKSFEVAIESHNKQIATRLEVDTSDMAGKKVDILVNNTFVESITLGPTYETTELQHGDSLLLRLALPGDYDKNGIVEVDDYIVWKQQFGAMGSMPADGNSDGVVDSADYTIWRNHFDAGATQALAMALVNVPEPGTKAMASTVVVVSLLLSQTPRISPARMRVGKVAINFSDFATNSR